MQFEKKSFDWKEEREGGGFGRAYIHNNKALGSNRITTENHPAPDHNNPPEPNKHRVCTRTDSENHRRQLGKIRTLP